MQHCVLIDVDREELTCLANGAAVLIVVGLCQGLGSVLVIRPGAMYPHPPGHVTYGFHCFNARGSETLPWALRRDCSQRT